MTPEQIVDQMKAARERIACRLDAARATKTRAEKEALMAKWKDELQPAVLAETLTLLRAGWTGKDYRVRPIGGQKAGRA